MLKKVAGCTLLLIAFLQPRLSALAAPEPASPTDAFQEGLYLQRTVGDLNQALAAYNRALQSGQLTQDGMLVENVLLREAETLEWQGKSKEVQKTILALNQKLSPVDEMLGAARFFPQQYNVLFQVRLNQLLQAPIISEKLEALKVIQAAIPFIELLQIDPLRDIRQITLGALFTEENLSSMMIDFSKTEKPSPYLAMVEGNLQKLRLDVLLEMAGKRGLNIYKETIEQQEVSFITIPEHVDTTKGRYGLLKPTADTLVLGDADSIRQFLRARSGQEVGVRGNQQIFEMASHVSPAEDVWLVASADHFIGALKKAGKVIPALENTPQISSLMLTAKLSNELKLLVDVLAKDNQSAKTLGDIARGLVALTQFVPQDEPAVQKLVKSLTVEAKEREIRISALIPGELMKNVHIGSDVSDKHKSKDKSAKAEADFHFSLGDSEGEKADTQHGWLNINAIPGATVFVDDKKIGVTPLVKVKLSGGDHTVLLDAGQDNKKTFQVHIEGGKTQTLAFQFTIK